MPFISSSLLALKQIKKQLAQSLTTGNDTFGSPPTSGSASSLYAAEAGLARHPNSATADAANVARLNEEESALAADINRTISAMTDLIERKMMPCAERTGKSQHILLVKRYREILFDCSADFKKTSAAVARKREQMELFRGSRATSGGSSGQGNGNGADDEAMEHLLRERNAIGNSLQTADSVLGQAAEVHSELRSQGSALRGVRGTVMSIAGNVPGLNRLIDNIRKKRNKDDMIVSGVIASCILFTLWYVLG
jgi:Golgi SNAP receptor complex protein 1